MKRTEPRDGWGWETEIDLYNAIEKVMGFAGTLVYQRERTSANVFHLFGYHVNIHGNAWKFAARVSTSELRSRRVADIAKDFSIAARKQMASDTDGKAVAR